MIVVMKNLLITTAFFTAPMVSTVVAQSDTSILKRQIAEQNRQIVALEQQVDSLQSQLNLERSRKSGATLIQSPKVQPKQSAKTHTVVSGDTFSGIAKKNGIKLAELISANKGVSPSKISIGQKLNIPTAGNAVRLQTPPRTIPKAVRVVAPSKSGTHLVSKGDTFYGIAKANGVSISDLRSANPGLNPSKLKIGTRLNLVKPKVAKKAPVRPTVKKAEPKMATNKKPAYKPLPAIQSTPAPVVNKPAPIKNVEPTAPVARAVAVSSIMTYGEFARRNGTTTSVLNALNGLDLPSDEPMAVGSELFVPNKY